MGPPSRRVLLPVALVRPLVVLGVYATAVVWLTWPLAPLAGTHTSGASTAASFDGLYSAWVLAHEARALVLAPGDFADGNIYHPARETVFYGPSAIGALPYFAPAYALTGNPALAVNFVLLGCTALTAAGLHLVLFLWTGSHAAGAIGGATFLTCRWVLWGFVAATPHIAALVYLPWIVHLAATPLDSARRWTALLVLVVLQCTTDLVYVALGVLVPLGVLAVTRLARPARRRAGWRLAALLVAAVLVLLPLLAAHSAVRRQIADVAAHTAWASRERRVELTHLLWRDSQTPERPTTMAPATLALVTLGGLVALVRTRRGARGTPAGSDATAEPLPVRGAWQHALLWTVVGVLISLGPVMAWRGEELTSPHALLGQWTPLYEVIRRPARLGVAGLIGSCLLAGLAFAEIAAWLRRRGGSALPVRAAVPTLAAAVVAAAYLVPPVGVKPVPPAYPVAAVPEVPASFRQPLLAGDEPLLHLPALPGGSRRPVPHWHARAMYLSTFHWRPLLNGYSSYWPPGFVERMRLAERLPDPAALRELERETGVGLVWVDLRRVRRADRRRWADPKTLSHGAGLRLVAREDDQLLFAVRLPGRGERDARPAHAGD